MDGFKNKEEYLFPNFVNICTLRGACPCNCVHCPVGLAPANEREERFGNTQMDLSLFKKIVDEIGKYHHSVARIHGVGEPLLWKQFMPAMDYLRKSGIRSWLFTSLTTRDYASIKELARACSIVEISLNSTNPEDYMKTKGLSSYAHTVDNIMFLRKYITEHNLKTRLLLSRVQSEETETDAEFVRYWKQQGIADDVFIRGYHTYNGILHESESGKTPMHAPCHVHWSRFNIDADGTVAVCFNEFFKGKTPENDFVLGNITTTSIYSIWHSEAMSEIREAQLAGKELPALKQCITCTHCQPLNTTQQTSEYQVRNMEC